jgi:hypothetical protein
MPQIIYNPNNNNNRNKEVGKVVGTVGIIIVSVVGVFAFLSALGSIGSAASSSAAIRTASNNAAVRYNEPERAAMANDQWEKQNQKLLEQLKGESALTPARPIEWKILDLTELEVKRAEPFVLSESIAEKVMPRKDIPGLEEPRIAFYGDILNIPTDEVIELDLPSFLWRDYKLINSISPKYKTISDIWVEEYLSAYPEYQDILSRMNPVSRTILKPRIRKRYSNGDNHTLISAVQEFSDSMQVTETDISSINIAEETIINEFHDIGYNHDIAAFRVTTELDKYDVTPQALIQDIPKAVNPAIPDKITAW